MSSYSPDVRQYQKSKLAEAVRNARHAQQQRQQQRPVGNFGFDRTRLPDPSAYFEAQGLTLKGKGAWRDAVCPFHDDSLPSLRVRLETGAFKCMACGAHGGDVLAYHMKLHGLTFKAAVVALGAWIGGAR